VTVRALLVSAGIGVGIGLAGCTLLSSQEESIVPDAETMRLTSPAFTDGGAIPEDYTCDGGDLSPPLAWEGVPEGVHSFALIVTDPDAGGFVHWVLAGIPADVRELPEGEGDAIGRPGRNGFGGEGWGGPCPPSGEHRYAFELLALSEPLRGESAPNVDRVRSVAEGATLARAELTGVYARR
jgi:Raf kinase inhibitor-like YbhB/YbcL family protein